MQDIIVILVVIVCVLYAGFHIMNYFRSAKKGENPCSSCTSGCDLRRMMEEKKKDCTENIRKNKKNCCK